MNDNSAASELETDITGSFTRMIGNPDTTEKQIFDKAYALYFEKLVALAQHKVKRLGPVNFENTDPVHDALIKFWDKLQASGYNQLNNRIDLWKILSVITKGKVIDEYRKLKTKKRGGDFIKLEPDENQNDPIDQLPVEPDETDLVALRELIEELKQKVDPDSKAILISYLEGLNPTEISTLLKFSESKVRRKLKKITDQLETGFFS